MRRRGNLLKGESKFVDRISADDYFRMENITIEDACKTSKLSKSELLKIHSNNIHLFYIICLGVRHIKAISNE